MKSLRLLLISRHLHSRHEHDLPQDGPIDLPKVEGFTADSLIPSDELLYVRYRRVGTVSGKGDEALILEVNPT